MSELSKYEAYKKKLQGICDENDLTFRFRRNTYPITLTIKPIGGLEAQMSMLESAEDTGYTSPDAYIIFTYKDGDISYKTSETFTISESLFNKVKNLFKNMYFCWLQYFFRDVIERDALKAGMKPEIDELDPDDEADGEFDDLDGSYTCDEDELEEDESEDAEEIEGEADDSDATAVTPEEIKEATSIVRFANKASVGLLQRRMNIGFARAARIMDALEDAGVVGTYNGSQPREVLPVDEPEDEAEAKD